MAHVTNTLTAVTPKLLAQGLMALREMALFPRLVNSSYSAMAGERGSTIDVPLPGVVTGISIGSTGSSNVATDPTAVAPTSVPIAMDNWWEFPFTLDDKEEMEIMEGTIPMQASEAVRGLANKIDSTLIDQYLKVTQFQGKFTSLGFDASLASPTVNATGIRKILTKSLAPNENRHVVMTPDIEAQALGIRAFQDASWSGSVEAILNGNLNDKLGFRWWIDQNLNSSFVAGNLSADGVVQPNANVNAGVSTFTLATGVGETVNLNKGDIVTFSATGAGNYVVQSDVNIVASSTGSITISPPLRVALVTTDTMSFVSGYKNVVTADETGSLSLAFHRDGFAFANRPLKSIEPGLGSISQTAVDPISGLALRLEVTREYKRTRYSYDALWGVNLVRPEYVVRFHAMN